MPKLNMGRHALYASLAAFLLSPTIAAADWSGVYAGAQLDTLVGDEISADALGTLSDNDAETDPIISAFAGYQIQQGDYVFGGEVALGQANNGTIDGTNGEEADSRLIDIKGRVGYDLGQTLVYGVAGFSQTRLLDSIPDVDEDTSTGFNFGFGVDYKINEQFTIGAEYLVRDLTLEDNVFGEDVEIDTRLETLGIRAAFNF